MTPARKALATGHEGNCKKTSSDDSFMALVWKVRVKNSFLNEGSDPPSITFNNGCWLTADIHVYLLLQPHPPLFTTKRDIFQISEKFYFPKCNYDLDADVNAIYKWETGNYGNSDMTRRCHFVSLTKQSCSFFLELYYLIYYHLCFSPFPYALFHSRSKVLWIIKRRL